MPFFLFVPLTDLFEAREKLFHIYPVQKLLDIAKGGTDVIDEQVYIHSGDAVALRGPHDLWFSCWVSGSACEARTCPGRDRPFQENPHSQYNVACRGEIFHIYAEHRRHGDRIRHDDKVALYYSSMDNNDWYVSCHYTHYNTGLNGVKTTPSPGNSFRNGDPDTDWCCHDEYYSITNNGLPGRDIKDRQTIQLYNEHRPCYLKPLGSRVECYDGYRSDASFQLFRKNSPFSVASHDYQT